MRIFLKISEKSMVAYFCHSHVMSICKLIMLTCDLSMSTCNIVMPKRKINMKTCNIIEVACYLMILNVDMIMSHVNIETVIHRKCNTVYDKLQSQLLLAFRMFPNSARRPREVAIETNCTWRPFRYMFTCIIN